MWRARFNRVSDFGAAPMLRLRSQQSRQADKCRHELPEIVVTISERIRLDDSAAQDSGVSSLHSISYRSVLPDSVLASRGTPSRKRSNMVPYDFALGECRQEQTHSCAFEACCRVLARIVHYHFGRRLRLYRYKCHSVNRIGGTVKNARSLRIAEDA